MAARVSAGSGAHPPGCNPIRATATQKTASRKHVVAIQALVAFLIVSGTFAQSEPAKFKLCIVPGVLTNGKTAAQLVLAANQAVAALKAVEDINTGNCAILGQGCEDLVSWPGGRLQLEPVVYNTENFAASTGAAAMLQCWEQGGHGVIGLPLSAQAMAGALMTGVFEMPLISHVAGVTSLSDKETYPLFSRSRFSEEIRAICVLDICDHFGWRQITLLYRADVNGLAFAVDVDSYASRLGIEVSHVGMGAAPDDAAAAAAARNLGESTCKVIVVIGLPEDTIRVIRQMTEQGIEPTSYVWVVGRQNTHTVKQLLEPEEWPLVERHLSIDIATGMLTEKAGLMKEHLTGFNISRLQDVLYFLNAEPTRELGAPPPVLTMANPVIHWSVATMHDAVWAFAAGLGAAFKANAAVAAEAPGRMAFQQIVSGSVKFDGATGPLEWDSKGDRVLQYDEILLESLVNGTSLVWGKWMNGTGVTMLPNAVFPWPDGTEYPEVPSDGISESSRPTAVYASVATAALVLLLISFGIYAYRKRIKNQFQDQLSDAQKKVYPPGLVGEDSAVTFVVTDIQGSTSLWEKYPADMMTALKVHDKLLRKLLEKYHGYEIYTQGDSFVLSFHEAQDAIGWCMAVQKQMKEQPWPPSLLDGGFPGLTAAGTKWMVDLDNLLAGPQDSELLNRHKDNPLWLKSNDYNKLINTAANIRPGSKGRHAKVAYVPGLRVRMGIHSGVPAAVTRHEVTQRAMYQGPLLSVTKAVSDSACGGQVVLTSEVIGCLAHTPEVSLLHLGCHELKPPSKYKKVGVSNASQTSRGSRVVQRASVDISRRDSSDTVRAKVEMMKKQRDLSFESSHNGYGPSSTHGSDDSSHQSRCSAPAADLSPGQRHKPPVKESRTAADLRVQMFRSSELVPMTAKDAGDAQSVETAEIFMAIERFMEPNVMFPPINTRKMRMPGFFQAPKPASVTIVSASMKGILELQDMPGLFDQIINQVHGSVCDQLEKHHGCECESAFLDYVLAFPSAYSAMLWATEIQDALMGQEWPYELEVFPAMETLVMQEDTVFQGPRLGIGMATGAASDVRPGVLTGRPHYSGAVVSQAEALKDMAAGGQVLCTLDTWTQRHSGAAVSADEASNSSHTSAAAMLKGKDEGVQSLQGSSHQVYSIAIEDSAASRRAFPKLPAAGPAGPHGNRRGKLLLQPASK